jgi:hypothetical protein
MSITKGRRFISPPSGTPFGNSSRPFTLETVSDNPVFYLDHVQGIEGLDKALNLKQVQQAGGTPRDAQSFLIGSRSLQLRPVIVSSVLMADDINELRVRYNELDTFISNNRHLYLGRSGYYYPVSPHHVLPELDLSGSTSLGVKLFAFLRFGNRAVLGKPTTLEEYRAITQKTAIPLFSPLAPEAPNPPPTTFDPAKTVPRNFQAAAGNGQINASWEPPNQGQPAVTGYQVRVRNVATNVAILPRFGPTTLSVAIARSSGTYETAVRSVHLINGEEKFSNFSATVTVTLGAAGAGLPLYEGNYLYEGWGLVP